MTWKADLTDTGEHLKQELEGTKNTCLKMGLQDAKKERRAWLGPEASKMPML